MTWYYLGLITHVLYIHFSLMFSGEPMLILGYTFTKWYFTFVLRLYLYRTFITVSRGFYLQIIARKIHVDVTLVFVNIVGAFRLMRDRVIINFITLVEDLLPPLNSRKSFHLKKKKPGHSPKVSSFTWMNIFQNYIPGRFVASLSNFRFSILKEEAANRKKYKHRL